MSRLLWQHLSLFAGVVGLCLLGVFWLDGLVASLSFPDFVVSVFSFVTLFGDWRVLVCACVVLFVVGFRSLLLRGFAERLFVGVAVGWVVSRSLKVLFGRARPFVEDFAGDFTFFAYNYAYSSFPSGHSVVCAVFACVLWLYLPRLWFIPLLLAFAGGLSRMVLGVHFLSDVVLGLYIGFLCGLYAVRRLR